jgi:hypothetical protein
MARLLAVCLPEAVALPVAGLPYRPGRVPAAPVEGDDAGRQR